MDAATRHHFLKRRLGDPELVVHAERLLASHPERIDPKVLHAMIVPMLRQFTRSRDGGDGDER